MKDHPMRWLLLFQSTLSVRRATSVRLFRDHVGEISIHALRKESDLRPAVPRSCRRDFNPRSP